MTSEPTDRWSARPVFFVTDAERALSFYREKLGCSLDWNHEHEGRAFVFQVNLRGVALIVNQIEGPTEARAGHGRVFIGLEDDQVAGFWRHLEKHLIEITLTRWGEPTIVIEDLDGNEIFFWLSEEEREKLRRRMAEHC